MEKSEECNYKFMLKQNFNIIHWKENCETEKITCIFKIKDSCFSICVESNIEIEYFKFS